ncbi:MAG: hypothetical protein KY462_09985 [Actinobacteria bacterium]|nr:hypothetical protein [Actinomycetota bacterium]
MQIMAAMRRMMRRHQGLPASGSKLPMWRLIAGEIGWAGRQLLQRPSVLVALVVGFAATLSVLGAAAPGPVLTIPWRVLTAITAGWLVASAVRGIQVARAHGDEPANRAGEQRPVLGAAVISGGLAVAVLTIWLAVWLVAWVT